MKQKSQHTRTIHPNKQNTYIALNLNQAMMAML